MSTRPLIAAVGLNALAWRVADDLRIQRGHRRVILVFDNHDIERLRGLRGDEVLWLDYSATKAQYAFVRDRGFTAVTIEQAREALHGRS